jgi:tetratricopeptide (TPR) repeat protein
MLRQSVNRLNQWVRAQHPVADWKLDPMYASLPAKFAELPLVKAVDTLELSRFDGFALQEAIWLRDASSWARGDALDDLERAESLFDWTVRNIQVEAKGEDWTPQVPWETLLLGRGTIEDRAWLFVAMARQQGIEAGMLALPPLAENKGEAANAESSKEKSEATGEKADGGSSAMPRVWCIGVLAEGQVYLFDPMLGLPIPGPDGLHRDAAGQLAIRPATLAQVAADDGLLRRLDVDDAHKYWVTASDLQHVAVCLEASPTYVSQRMQLLESHLAGAQKMVLTYSPTAQAAKWKAANVSDVQLWHWPFETLVARSHMSPKAVEARVVRLLPFYADRATPLLKGRILHLKGKLIGADGAIKFYQEARPSNQDLAEASVHPMLKQLQMFAKQNASYWAGLVAYQRANYATAIDYFKTRTLEAAPNGTWTDGAQYNLARTYEASGETDWAVLQYQSSGEAVGGLGGLLRAKWLKEVAPAETPKP